MHNKIKRILIFALFITVGINLSFAKAKKKDKNATKAPVVPMWIEDEGRLKMFPMDEYVSAIGMGVSEQESQNKASAQISKSIKSVITSNVESSYEALSKVFEGESKSSYQEIRKISQDIQTESNNALYKVEFTKPYYDESYGMYLCVAYINKDDAWQMIKPKLEVSSKSFKENYQKASNIKDVYQKILAIKNSQKVLKDFYEVYDFALFINTIEASKYKTIDDLVQQSYSEIYYLTNDCVLYIMVNKDNQDRVKNKITEKITQTGFKVGPIKTNYIFDVRNSYEISKSDDIYLSYPSIKITVLSNSQIVASYAKEIGKCAGFDKAACERRIFKEFEDAIEEMEF